MWPFRKNKKLTSEAQPLNKDQLEQVQAGYSSSNPDEREAFQKGQEATINDFGSDDQFHANMMNRINRARLAQQYVKNGGPEDPDKLNEYLNGELTEEQVSQVQTYSGTNIDGTRNAFTDEHVEGQEEVVSSFGKSNSR